MRQQKELLRVDRLVIPMTLDERSQMKWLAAQWRSSEAEAARRVLRERFELETRPRPLSGDGAAPETAPPNGP
jgi:hypothetical protein